MQYILLFLLLFIGVVESIRHGKLTVAGGITGGIIALLIFIGAGWTGVAMLAAFFLLGTMATSWKQKQKAQTGIAQEPGGKRHAGQVLANGGAAALLGALSLFFPGHQGFLSLLMAGAFSAAMADTLSSELGTLYGKRFYNIITLKHDQKGLDGVISLEGTLIGMLGSCLVALLYSIGFGWNDLFLWIILAGTVGNLVDSFLGATLERKGILGNDAVNFLNTVAGALFLLFLNKI